jgi:hypothetical protein
MQGKLFCLGLIGDQKGVRKESERSQSACVAKEKLILKNQDKLSSVGKKEHIYLSCLCLTLK